jgi:hypothetical protein
MALPIPHTRPPYSLIQGNLVRLVGDKGRDTVAGIHKIGRSEHVALQNGAFIKRACNSFQDQYAALQAAEHWLVEEQASNSGMTRPDEILRVIRAAIAKAEGRADG